MIFATVICSSGFCAMSCFKAPQMACRVTSDALYRLPIAPSPHIFKEYSIVFTGCHCSFPAVCLYFVKKTGRCHIFDK